MRWRVGVRTMLLATAAFAVWFAALQDRAENARLRARIDTMRSLARELVVADEGKVAAVQLREHWMDDDRWEVHLPAGEYRLNLATRGIEAAGLVPPLRNVAIPAGRRRIGLEQKRAGAGHRVAVALDGETAMEADEPEGWNPGKGSAGGGVFTTSRQFDGAGPVVLYRRRFTRPDADGQVGTPDGPCEGILLWIERVR